MAELTKAIERFLTLDYDYGLGDSSGYGDSLGFGDGSGDGFGNGHGNGDGSGSGSGSGYGDGSGDGSGSGNGYGSGDGSGYGSGSGSGLRSFNGQKVYYIDNVATVIEKVYRNLAKGFIINSDLTTQACFIVKGQNKFAHGETLEEAQKALQDKIFDYMDTEEKIGAFLAEFKPGVKYPAKSFYEWHHRLTGSCEFGRNAFVKNHGIDLECGLYTVEEFIEYTKNDYGGNIINQLAERINTSE